MRNFSVIFAAILALLTSTASADPFTTPPPPPPIQIITVQTPDGEILSEILQGTSIGYCGGDPVNRSDAMGTDWKWTLSLGWASGMHWEHVKDSVWDACPARDGAYLGEVVSGPAMQFGWSPAKIATLQSGVANKDANRIAGSEHQIGTGTWVAPSEAEGVDFNNQVNWQRRLNFDAVGAAAVADFQIADKSPWLGGALRQWNGGGAGAVVGFFNLWTYSFFNGLSVGALHGRDTDIGTVDSGYGKEEDYLGWGRTGLRTLQAAMGGPLFVLGLEGEYAGATARSAWQLPNSRMAILREVFTDSNGALLTSAERDGLKFTIRRIEALDYRLMGSVKTVGNQGIDLVFEGIGANEGRFALAEAKRSASLSALKIDASGIRQGSIDFFRTRLETAGETGLLFQQQQGNVDYFVGLQRSQRLFRVNFSSPVNFRTNPAAAVEIPPLTLPAP